MSCPDNNPSLTRRNLVKRRRYREDTLLKKAYELYMDHETEVYMVFHHHHDNKYRVFTTQPEANFPPSLENIKMMYPVPVIHTPDTLEALLEKRRRASRADIVNDDSSPDIDISESYEQGEDVSQEIPGNQDPIQGNLDDDDGHIDGIAQAPRPSLRLQHGPMSQDFVLKPAPLPAPQTIFYRTHLIPSSMSSGSSASSPALSSGFPHDQPELVPRDKAISFNESKGKTPKALAVNSGGIKKAGSSPSGRGGFMRRG